MKNILICGPPGVGKTTLIKKILEKLNLKAGGFYTEEIKKSGNRVGFKIISLDNHKGILAHIRVKGMKRVGRYGVNIDDLEDIGVKSLDRALRNEDLVIIDEIGKMEIFSEKFKEKVLACLNSEKFVLATIGIGGDKYISRIKERDDVIVFKMNRENRDELMDKVLSLILKENL